MHDPGIGFITLTRVQVSPDLQLARVFYTTHRRPEGAAGHRAALDARDAVLPPAGRRAAAAAARAGARVPVRRIDRRIRTASSRSCATCTRRNAQRAADATARSDVPSRRPTDDDDRDDAERRARRWRTRSASGSASSSPRTCGRTATRSARSSPWRMRCGARQGRARRQPRRAAAADAGLPRCRRRSRSPTAIDDPGDAVIVMECGDLSSARASRALERGFVINIDHHLGNTMYGALNWFDLSAAACGEMVFDLVARAGRAADAGDRDARLHRDPHRHRVVPLLEHLAAHVRHLPAVRRGRRRSACRRAQHLRQQQPRPAEAVRRGAQPDGARSPAAASRRCLVDQAADRTTAAAPTRTPKG